MKNKNQITEKEDLGSKKEHTKVNETINNLCVVLKEIESDKGISQINPNILFKYINLQDNIPFEIYYKNILHRIETKDKVKKNCWLREQNISPEFDIVKIINDIINKSNMRLPTSLKEEKKTKEGVNQNNSLTKQEKKKKNKMINNNNDDTSNNNNTVDNSQDLDNTSSHFSNLFELKIQGESGLNKELESYEKKVFSDIMEKTKDSQDSQIKYFDDCNNLYGESFEKKIIKYIFELFNCFSEERDFVFYSNIKKKCDKFDEIFTKLNLNKLNEIQFDFAIYNVKLIDFINVVIYLYNNIIDFSNLKIEPFKDGMNLSELINIKKNPIYKNHRIDIIGEIGGNIYNEQNKIDQLTKYDNLFKNLDYLKKNKKDTFDSLMNSLKMTDISNHKVLLFITNGDFENFIENETAKLSDPPEHEKYKFKKTQKKINMNSLSLYINSNKISKFDFLIEKLILDYDSKISSCEDNDFGKILKQIKIEKLQNYITSHKYKEIVKKFDAIEKANQIEGAVIDYLKKKERQLLKQTLLDFFKLKNSITQEITVNQEMLDLYKTIDIKKEFIKDIHRINVLFFINNQIKPEEIDIKGKNINKYCFTYSFEKMFKDKSCDNNLIDYNKFWMKYKKEKEQLKSDIKNSTTIIVFVTNSFRNQEIVFLKLFCQDNNLNFLSYFFIYEIKNSCVIIDMILDCFHEKHIVKKLYSENICKEIEEFISHNKDKMEKSFNIFYQKKKKYNSIIDTYNKYSKNTVFVEKGKSSNIPVENYTNQKELLKLKIQQDILFYLTLSIKINYSFCENLSFKFNEENYITEFMKSDNFKSIFTPFCDKRNKQVGINQLSISKKEIKEVYENNNMASKELQTINKLFFVENEKSKELNVDELKNKDEYFIFNESSEKKDKNNCDIISSDEEKKKIKLNNLSCAISQDIKTISSLLTLKIYYKIFENVMSNYFKKEFLNNIAEVIVENEK